MHARTAVPFTRAIRRSLVAAAAFCLVVAAQAGAAPARMPDLAVVRSTGLPTDVASGDRESLSVTVRNVGTRKAPATKVGAYLSTNATKGASDSRIGTGTVRALAAGARASARVKVTIPSLKSASYNLLVCADSAGKLREGSEKNQCRLVDLIRIKGASAPATPVLLGTTPGSPGSDATPTVFGTAEPGVTVRLHASLDCTDSAVATGTASATGTFAIDAPVNENAPTQLTASAKTPSSIASPCTVGGLVYVHDSIAPAGPSGLAFSPIGPGSDATPTLSGTASGSETVRVHVGAGCIGGVMATSNPGVNGGFSTDVTVDTEAVTTMSVSGSDAAGNLGCSSTTLTYEHGSIPAPVLASTPASPSTNTSPDIEATAPNGANSVRVFASPNCSGAAIATIPVTPAATWTHSSAAIAPNTTVNFSARYAGPGGTQSPCSAGLGYRHDTIAPAPPSPAMVRTISSDITPDITDTMMEAEPLTVRVYVNNGGCAGAPEVIAGAKSGTWTATITGSPNLIPTNTSMQIGVRYTDTAGNASTCVAVNYTHDDTPPPVPDITTTTPASPSGNANPVVNGTAEAVATITLSTNAMCTNSVGTGVTTAGGTFAVTATSALPAGSNEIWATATDQAGNMSACSTTSVVYVKAHVVTVNSFSFSPSALTFAAGGAISFQLGSGAHNVHFTTPEGFGDSAGYPGASMGATPYVVPFPTARTYSVQCGIHPFMTATYTVT